MTIYKVSYAFYDDYTFYEEETIGYYQTREMAKYVAKHYEKMPDIEDVLVEEIHVQNTCPKFED